MLACSGRLTIEQVFPAVESLQRLIRLTDAGREYFTTILGKAFELRPKRKLIDEGHACDHIYIVLSGWLAEYRQLRDGGRQILNFRVAGEITGVECLLYKRALHSVMSLTSCMIAQISRDQFEDMQSQFPRLASAFVLSAIRDATMLQERTVVLGRRPAFSRIAHLLLELDRRLRTSGVAADGPLPFPLKQQDVADAIGLTTPYVNRVLKEMRERNLVVLREEALEIRDPLQLAAAAGFRGDYLDPLGQTEWQRNRPDAI